MVHRSSITFRLAAGIGLSQLLLTAGLVVVGTIFIHRQLVAAFDTALHGRAMSLVALVHYPEQGKELELDTSLLPPPEHPIHPDFYLVKASDGRVIANSTPPPLQVPTAGGKERYWDFTWHGVPYRGLWLQSVPVLDSEEDIPGPPARITVAWASPVVSIQESVWGGALSIALASVVLLLAADLLAFWMIRRSLDPLHDLTSQAAAISPRQWAFTPSAETTETTELAPLVSALETMLERLRASFQRQQEFLADAAHELKTPVAILKTSLQILQQRPRSPEEYRAGVERSLDDVERLEQLLHRMLRLARLEQGAERPTKSLPVIDLGVSCDLAIARLLPLAQARQIEIESCLDAGTPAEQWVAAELDDLELVWVNLLENAVLYSPAGSRIRLERGTEAGSHRVAIEDQGPGIPAAELPHIFERFHRGDPSRTRATGGFGLGLAIARAIVQACGGQIEASSQPGHGARFQVRLPAVAAPVSEPAAGLTTQPM